jgi:hypothetical protein
MKFLCLAYYDEKAFEALSKDQVEAIVSRCPPHDKDLRGTGKMISVASLSASRDSVSIHPKNGKPVITDGPFTEAKEVLGSFFLIEAANKDEAVRIAALHPAAHLGETVGWGVEVRPIDYFDEP